MSKAYKMAQELKKRAENSLGTHAAPFQKGELEVLANELERLAKFESETKEAEIDEHLKEIKDAMLKSHHYTIGVENDTLSHRCGITGKVDVVEVGKTFTITCN